MRTISLLFLFLVFFNSLNFAQMPTKEIFPLLNSGSHIGRLDGLFVKPNKKEVLSIGEEGTIRVMNAETGLTTKVYSIHKKGVGLGKIYASALSPDGQLLAVGGKLSANKNQIWLIDLQSWTIHKILDGHEEGVKSLAFSPEGKWLVSGGQLGDMKLWTTTDYKSLILPKQHNGYILDLAVSKDAQLIFSSDRTGALILWTKLSVDTYKPRTLQGHASIPLSLAIAPNDSFLVSADLGGQLRGWNREGNLLWSSKEFMPTSNPLGAVSISPNSRYIAFKEDVNNLFSWDFKVHILDLNTSKIVYASNYHKDIVIETTFYNDEVLFSANGGTTRLILNNWKKDSIKQEWYSKGKPISQSSFDTDLSVYLGYNSLLTETDKQKGVYYSFKTQVLQSTKDEPLIPVSQKYFEGKKLEKINSHTLRVIGGNTIYFDDKDDGRIQNFFFTKDGNIIVLGDFVVKHLSSNGQLLQSFGDRAGELRTASVSPDNRYLTITGTDQITQLFNLESKELLLSLFISDTNEWVLWSPYGYYTSSRPDASLLSWFSVEENKLPQSFSKESIDIDKFRNADLLKKIITLGSFEKAFQTDNSIIGPIISVVKNPSKIKREKFNVEFTVEAINKLESIEIYLNKELINKYQGTSTFISIKEPLTLNPKENTFIILAKDINGLITKETQNIFFDVSPEVLLATGHNKPIPELIFSPNGKYVASCSMDNTLKIWNVNAGNLHQILDFSASEWMNISGIKGAGFHPTNSSKICTFSNNRLYVFDITTRQIQQEMFEKGIMDNMVLITDLAYTKDGQYILTVASDGQLRYWNTETGQLEHKIKLHENRITAISITPNGKFAITQGQGNFLKVFDIQKKQTIKEIPFQALNTFPKGSGDGDFISISTDNRYVALGGMFKDRFEVFDLETEEKLYERIVDQNQFTDASFSNGDQYLAISSINKPIQLLDPITGNLMKNFSKNSKLAQSLSFHPTQALIISGHGVSNGFVLKSWFVPDGKLLTTMGNDIRGVTSLAISPNGKYLASSGIDQTVWVWNMETLQLQAKVKVGEYCVELLGTYDLTFNFNGSLLAIASCDNVLRILDINKQKIILEKTFSVPPRSIAFHPKQDWLYFADEKLKFWDLTSNTIKEIGNHDGSISNLELSKDGSLLGCISRASLSLWDMKKEKNIFTYPLPEFNPKQKETYSSTAGMLGNISFTDTYALSFSSDNHFLTFSGSLFGSILKYHIPSKKIQAIQEKNLIPDKYISQALSYNNRYLAVGKLNEQVIEIFDLQKNQLIKTLGGHKGAIGQLMFSGKEEYLYSCSKDGTIKIWDWRNSQEIASLVSSIEGNYTFVTNDHYYYSNHIGQTAINFLVNSKVFPFEQFDLQLNRPDILLERLGATTNAPITAYKKAYLKRLDKMGFTPKAVRLDFTSIPTITIRQSLVEDYTKNENYTFEVVANGGKEFIKQLNVFVNDVPIYGRNGLDYSDKNQVVINKEIELALSNGRNKIQLSAINKSRVESLKETFYINYEGVPKKADLHLLIFGVDEYDNAPNLDFSEKDAKNIQQLFQARATDFDKIYQYPLLGKDFSKEAVLKLRKTLEKTKVDDQILIFYAGHGFLDKENDFFLTCKNTNFNTPEETGVSYETLENLLDGIPARQKLVLIDACHSGEIDEDYTAKIQTANANQKTNVKFKSTRDTGQRSPQIGMNNSFDLMKELFVDLRRGTGATVIAAARGVELAGESSLLENGFFTHAIISGLKKREADLNQDGKITVSELKTYVSKKVTELTNGLQQPTSRLENISNDFRIW